MVYQHPLAYLLGMEGLALLKAWAGDDGYDEQFVRARLAEVRRLLDDPELAGHPGVQVETGAAEAAHDQWSGSYDDPGNALFELDEPFLDDVLAALPPGTALDAACGTGRMDRSSRRPVAFPAGGVMGGRRRLRAPHRRAQRRVEQPDQFADTSATRRRGRVAPQDLDDHRRREPACPFQLLERGGGVAARGELERAGGVSGRTEDVLHLRGVRQRVQERRAGRRESGPRRLARGGLSGVAGLVRRPLGRPGRVAQRLRALAPVGEPLRGVDGRSRSPVAGASAARRAAAPGARRPPRTR